jgi:hypothetical protein
MPESIIEKLNQLYDIDNPNKTGRSKRKAIANIADNPHTEEVIENVQLDHNLQDDQRNVRMPTLRQLPDRAVVPDLVAAHMEEQLVRI